MLHCGVIFAHPGGTDLDRYVLDLLQPGFAVVDSVGLEGLSDGEGADAPSDAVGGFKEDELLPHFCQIVGRLHAGDAGTDDDEGNLSVVLCALHCELIDRKL
jgi:hypothetical protein